NLNGILVIVQADINRYITHGPLLPDETLVNKLGLSLQQRAFIFIPISGENSDAKIVEERLAQNAVELLKASGNPPNPAPPYDDDALKKRVARITALMEERKALQDLLKTLTDSQGAKSEEREFVAIIDPASATGDAPRGISIAEGDTETTFTIKPTETFFGGQPDATKFPEVRLKVRTAKADSVRARTPVSAGVSIDGLAYRRPEMVPIAVEVVIEGKPTEVINQSVAMAQFGPIMAAQAKSKTWAKLKTTGEFDASTGALIGYGQTSGTTIDSLKSVDSSVATITKTVADIKTAQQNEELNKQKAETERLQQELSLLKAKKDLADFKKANP
ncbi:MAG TPA: hypothetical protein VHD56_02720, partial [Tepidisphaeraceae bacterium]|nr:hypothetical protein [Tepidisphaeraceae bacterium]